MAHRARGRHTFYQRLTYKMLHDRRALLKALIDKVAVKEHITDALGLGHMASTLAVGCCVEQIDWAAPPEECVVKVNDGLGGLGMSTADTPADARLWGWDWVLPY